jgi:Eukaryotic porin
VLLFLVYFPASNIHVINGNMFFNSPGINFTEKWNTDNQLATEVSIEDQLVKGLKLSFDTQFVPQTG